MKKLILILTTALIMTGCGYFADDSKPSNPCEGKTGISGWYCNVKN
ncbi:MAG: hypothetical protein HOD85_12740 [Deltaproteobacteria bacterium]|nr:hypothetical protein [Deltaproteobacteria bacterium]